MMIYGISYIRELPNYKLNNPIEVEIIKDKDDDDYYDKTTGFSIYSTGSSKDGAIENLKHEIESMYKDLNADDNFSDEWLEAKAKLNQILKPV